MPIKSLVLANKSKKRRLVLAREGEDLAIKPPWYAQAKILVASIALGRGFKLAYSIYEKDEDDAMDQGSGFVAWKLPFSTALIPVASKGTTGVLVRLTRFCIANGLSFEVAASQNKLYLGFTSNSEIYTLSDIY